MENEVMQIKDGKEAEWVGGGGRGRKRERERNG